MSIQVVVNQPGPLPIEVTFNAVANTIMYLEVNGSIWSSEPNLIVGIGVALDGRTIGAARIFANPVNTHMAVVTAYIPVALSFGQHTLYLYRYNGETMSDQHDFFTAVIHY